MKPSAINTKIRIHLNRVNLKFRGAEANLEELFQNVYFKDNLKHVRLCHGYAIFFYALSACIDFLFFQSNLYALFAIRFFIVIPIFILGYFFSYASLYKKYWQQINFVYILLTGGSFISFTAIAQAPEAYHYYVGMFFCLMFGYTLIRERFIYSSMAGFTLISSYYLTSFYIVKMPTNILMKSNFYLFSANLLGMLIARHLEISARRDFYLEHKLSLEKERVLALNSELEKRVKERTLELEQSNRELSIKIDALNESESRRNKLEAKLRQAYKMEAIGTLAGGIAHDFNNILASAIGYTELALDDVPKGSLVEENLQEVYRAGLRARELVKQILTFARQAEEELKPIKVKPIVKEVIKLLRSTIPSNIEIESNIQSDSFILGDPINVHQMLMNLATNASHAMEEGGILQICTTDVHLTNEDIVNTKHLTPGSYIKMSVSDTGTGIEPDILESIFEPYFTTKQGGEGTGMGLAMVYGIIKKYKGDIVVESEPGHGSVFSLFLPIIQYREKDEVYRAERLPLGHERVLIVDDEIAIAKMESYILRQQGYEVSVKTCSTEALESFRSKPNNFDLVITDMTMPKMTGVQVATEMMKIRPDIPIILCTGYSQKITEQKAKELGIKAFAYKPIVKADLIKTVRKVLDVVNAAT